MSKDISVEISLRRFVALTDFIPEPMFQVNVNNPAGKDTVVMFGELSDALHLVARVFGPKVTNEPVTKVTKGKVTKRPARPAGFLDDWVVSTLTKGSRTVQELCEMAPEKVEGRGMASILRGLHRRQRVFSVMEEASGKRIWSAMEEAKKPSRIKGG